MSVHKDDVLLTTCKLNSERLEEIPWNTAGDPSSTGRSDFCSRIPHHKQSSIWPSRGKWYFNMWVWLIFLAGFSTEKIQEKKNWVANYDVHVYSHFAGFWWLFLFTSEKTAADGGGLCEVAELSEVPAEPFCCWPVFLLTNILVLDFQACSWESLAYLQMESTGSGSTKCSVLQLCSPVITSGSTRVIPILISLMRLNCSQEGNISCLPRTGLGVNSSFQIILWMVLKWNSSTLSVQPAPVFSLDTEIMGIGCCLMCWGLLSSRCTCLVGCGRTSSLITVKISNSSSCR